MPEALGAQRIESEEPAIPNAREGGSLEIELPFLIKEITPEVQRLIDDAIANDSYEVISQGYYEYVDANGKGRNLRLRESWSPSGTSYKLTDKRPIAPGIMQEHEIPVIDVNERSRIWELSKGQRVRKIRFKIPYEAEGEKYCIELDVFLRKNAGLVRAEVEFQGKSKKEGKRAMRAFRKHMPQWFGADLSENRRMKNSQLAKEGLPKKELAKKYGWEPIVPPAFIGEVLQRRQKSGVQLLDTKI